MFTLSVVLAGTDGREARITPAGAGRVQIVFAMPAETSDNGLSTVRFSDVQAVTDEYERNELAGDLANWLRPGCYSDAEIGSAAESLRIAGGLTGQFFAEPYVQLRSVANG